MKLKNFIRGDPWDVEISLLEAENAMFKMQSVFPVDPHVAEDSCVPAVAVCSDCSITLLEGVVRTSQFPTCDHKCPQSSRNFIGCCSFVDVVETNFRLGAPSLGCQ